ncbi:MAG: hypothetical protein WA783_16665 [Phormidesmis sp.]
MTIKADGTPPSAQEIRSMLLEKAPDSMLRALAVWLGLESLERQSDEIYDLARSLTDAIDVRESIHGFERSRVGTDEANS